MLSIHSRPCIYLAAIAFIFSWWTVTLSSLHPQRSTPQAQALTPINTSPIGTHTSPSPAISSTSSPSCPLPSFVRAKWHRALTGDVRTMMELLAEWQVEAEVLTAEAEARGDLLSVLPSFPRASFLRAQELARRLLAREKGLYASLPDYEWQEDDMGTLLKLDSPPRRFLPQTEVTATILLALCPLEQIVALPARMRTLPLFPAHMLRQLPHDIDRHNSEALFALKPDVAFIAHYTEPSTVHALRQQQITPFLITRINSLDEVLDTILKIGHVIHQPEKAELLTLFVQAGLSTLDRRLAVYANRCASHCASEHRPLYLHAFSTFSAPTQRSLAGQLAHRLGMNRLDTEQGNQWSILLDGERMRHLAPTWIVFSLHDPKKHLPALRNHPLLQDTPAYLNNQLFAVDETFQESPTHFLLLAYYDLVALILPQISDNIISDGISDDSSTF